MSTTFSRSFRFFFLTRKRTLLLHFYDKVYDLARNKILLDICLPRWRAVPFPLPLRYRLRSALWRIDRQLDGALQLCRLPVPPVYRALDGLGLSGSATALRGEQTGSAELPRSSSVICGANGLSSARKVLYQPCLCPLVVVVCYMVISAMIAGAGLEAVPSPRPPLMVRFMSTPRAA